MAPDAAVPPGVVTTDMFPERERFDAWRETFALRLVRVDVSSPDRSAFYAAMGMQPLERLSVVTCDISPVSLMRTKELIQDGNDDIALVICTSGMADVRYDGESVILRPGDATLLPHDRTVSMVANDRTKSLSLRLPRALLRDILGTAEPRCLQLIPRQDSRLRLLSSYAGELISSEAELRPSTIALADRQICELVAHLLDPTVDIARGEQFGGLKAARLKSVIAGIDQHLADGRLSAEWLGAKLGLSERYVQHLLAEAGVGFTQLVRRKRLERARAMLEDRAAPPRRIVDVAYAVGFNDLSNFNHAFRQHFGRTPSDVRRWGRTAGSGFSD
jgi:AraC-like DNA-binding protein